MKQQTTATENIANNKQAVN